ncbi:head maturation protease, ClpP-related [Actinoplanes sp. NPDC023936]|uniref:head maturation protease, ClpP-related n=1 Tax=Actinoplanes sp. NPDC023936 TaxID=3154910 RepID=UPI0034099A6A
MRAKTARPMARATDQPWYRIHAAAGSRKAEIHILDEIGFFGVSATDFVREVKALDVDQLDVHIASPGGDVFDAIAIFQALRNHPAAITTYVDSLAASAASFIALAGDKRVVAPYGSLMIHDAWGMAVGNAADMTKMAAELEKVSATLAQIYADRSGGKPEAWRDLMRDETWFNAAEAVEAGLMHQVQEDAAKSAPEAKNRWDLSVFAYAGRENAPAPRIAALARTAEPAAESGPDADAEPETVPTDTTALPDVPATDLPAAEPEPNTEPEEEDPVSTDLSEIRSRLGLDDAADETAIVAALEALQAKADIPVTDPAVEAEVEAAKAENADLRTEVEKLGAMVEKMSAKLADTEADAAAKTKAAVLDEAQRLGKFKVADRADWERDYDDAPAVTARLLARIKPGAEVPVALTGHAGGPEPTTTGGFDETEYERLFGEKAGA